MGIKDQPHKKTEQDYHEIGYSKRIDWVGESHPGSVNAKTQWRCYHGHEWLAPFSSIRKGKGCPYCARCAPKTEQDYHDLAQAKGFKWIGKLPKSTGRKTKWQCSKGHKWVAHYNSLQQGSGCPYCVGAGNNIQKTKQDYQALAKDRGFKWIGGLPKRVKDKTGWQCQNGHKWNSNYNNISNGNGCPDCYTYKGPERIKEVLRAMGIVYETEKRFAACKHKRSLPFDFFIPAAKLLIEHQGRQHFEPAFGDSALSDLQRNDKIKADWAVQSPYTLLCINYNEYNRISEFLADRLPDK